MNIILIGFLAVLVLLTGISAAGKITTLETTPLVNSTAWECAPVWSEDGTGLFYASNESGNFDILRVDADGTNKTRITNDSADEFPSFSWSTWENGSIIDRIVYISQSVGSDIWIIDADGTNESKLTDSGYNIDPALVCVPLPQISGMQPSGTIDNNMPAVSSNFSCSYGNISAVNLSVDGIDVTSNANITDSNVSYSPIEPLDCGDHNFTVRVESDLYTVGYGYRFFTIAYITNQKPTCVSNSTPTISANISCSYGSIATVTISVDGVNVTSNATIADSYISYTPTEPLLNGTHNATVCANSTHGINDSMTWVFYVNSYYPPGGGGGAGGGGYSCAPKIVFASNRSGNFDIWMMNMDGTGLMQLTNSPSNETHPVAVDSKTVYVSDESGSRDLWSMDLNGSNKQQLTSSAVDECMPAWSPIGGIVYTQRSCGGDDYNLFAMNTDGTGKTRLTNNPLDELSPVFSQSPYQLKVAYAIENDDSDIWTTSFKETDNKVRIWHLEGWYVLVCREVYGNEVCLELAKNGTMVDQEIVAINESFSMSCSGDTIITGTLHNINRSDDSAFEVSLVNVTQYSGGGGVLFSDATKILTNAPIRLCAMRGDLNSDSEITSTDAAIVLEIAVGSRPCDPETLAIADVSGDGRVSSLDALMILQNCTTSLCRK
ncbi:MAG: Protein TolB [Candidatus Argoarchaeum ethanivorans]|uniref:Protein TolB n=1 Tax=Candidatus Argoarchaeum ethanivorans TaxID=2608793 RepID=A0A811TCH3_9EURY|nr:MAG: Protein TolB [Candidatus Argoarchaeum ethanivorans]